MIPVQTMDENTRKNSGWRTAACVRIGLICCFLFLLFLPPLATIWMPKQETSRLENRKRATFPDFNKESPATFTRLLERYIADHVAFRETLGLLHNRALVVGFNKSPHPAIVLGKSGWLFHGMEGSMEDVLGKKSLSVDTLDLWAKKLQRRKHWLERQGVQYLFVIAPDKQSIYPEYLPDAFQKRMTHQKRMDQLIAFLNQYTNVTVLDLRPALLQAKAIQPVYYRTDTHWNWYGGWVAYQRIIDVIQMWFPEVRRLDERSVGVVEKRFDTGDMALRLGLPDIFQEMERAIWVPKPCAGEKKQRFNELSFIKTCAFASYRVLVVRDSFFTLIEPFLSESFHTSIYLWKPWPAMSSYDHPWVKEVLEEFKPDLVIEECVERFLDAEPTVSNEEEFEYAETAVLLDPLHGFDRIVAYKDAELSRHPDGLHITAGNDPGIVLQLQAVRRQNGLLRLVIDSPAETMLQLFFKYRPLDGYSEVNSMRFKIHPGTNELTIPLKHQWVGNPLRIDPGMVAGVYVLKKLELYLLPSIGALRQ
uniref:AlgX/AlgJ SGNH hydrolase-like domain-containing protein n=1 Tax=Desulfatirhabdium butyrativorans TaxID=340467 RepID=A0A7C4RRD7_9BACT